jgi:hypothetical protein
MHALEIHRRFAAGASPDASRVGEEEVEDADGSVLGRRERGASGAAFGFMVKALIRDVPGAFLPSSC